jgi:hypothetical protein
MKSKLVFLLTFAVMGVSQAQETKNLFNSDANVGIYLAPGVQLGPVAGQTALFTQIRGGVVLNSAFSIGGQFSWTVNEFTPEVETDPDLYMDMRLAALSLEYTFKPTNLFHFSIPVAFGAGEVEMDPKGDSDFSTDYAEENFAFVEPALLAQVNLTDFVKFYAGGTYRVILTEVDYRGNSAQDLSGFTFSTGLRFALFNSK